MSLFGFKHTQYAESEVEADLELFCLAVRACLQFWLDIHTKAEAWADNWCTGFPTIEAAYAAMPYFSNDYFEWDWGAAAREYLRTSGDYIQCVECHRIGQLGSLDCDCDASAEEPNGWDFEEWWEMGSKFPGYALEAALLGDGFATYRIALEPYTHLFESAIKRFLQEFDGAATNAEILAATLHGLEIQHVHGNVVTDFGVNVGVPGTMALEVTEYGMGGLNGWFDEEYVQEFLR